MLMKSRAVSQTLDLAHESLCCSSDHITLNPSWHVIVTGQPGVTRQQLPPSTFAAVFSFTNFLFFYSFCRGLFNIIVLKLWSIKSSYSQWYFGKLAYSLSDRWEDGYHSHIGMVHIKQRISIINHLSDSSIISSNVSIVFHFRNLFIKKYWQVTVCSSPNAVHYIHFHGHIGDKA